MSDVVIRVEELSKRYRLGLIGRTALHEDLSRWWARLRGQPDPTMRLDQLQRLEAKKAQASELHDDAEHIWALRDVNFEVKQGEVLGIIGKNGAGKSTLLKILSRVTAPTLGCVKIKGRIASLLEVGTGFHPELTGRENIFLNGAILGMNKAEVRAKFDEIVAFAELDKFIDTPVKRYSSGMYVRLAFAVAAHLEPEILVVDEVLAVGDAAFQKKCLGKMKDVAGHGRTVLFVSHNMMSISMLCTRALLLNAGGLQTAGNPLQVINAYQSEGTDHGCSKIADAFTVNNPALNITEITFNGSPSQRQFTDSTTGVWTLEIAGRLSIPTRMDVEIRLCNQLGAPIGIFSPGHEHGEAKVIPAGKFRLERRVSVPPLNKGQYELRISITTPNEKVHAGAASAVILSVSGYPMATGRVLDCQSGCGWIFLKDAMKQMKKTQGAPKTTETPNEC